MKTILVKNLCLLQLNPKIMYNGILTSGDSFK